MPKIKYPYEFDPKKRRISKLYRTGRFGIYLSSVLLSLLITLTILFSGFNITLRNFASSYPFSTILYGFTLLLTYTIIQLPLSFYSTYIYEHQFKLSRYTISSWLKDFLKGSLIGYVITLVIISLLYLSIRNFSPWWLYAGIIYIIFSTFMNYVYPLVIVPFMWKTEPYRNKSMKEKILGLCRKLGVMNIKNVVVIKESEKSTRPNAVFMGFGNSKRIGLFDNLLHNFTNGEIETVVGHELGHYVNKDILRNIVLEAIFTFPVLFAVDYFVKVFSPALGISGISDLAALPLIGLIYSTLGFLLMPIINTHSRWRESQADEFALKYVRKTTVQISTEKRLADMSLSELKVNPLIEFWLFTHPATSRRIKMAEEWNKKLKK